MPIASRELKYVREDGTIVSVPVHLYAPEGEGTHWWCRYTIGWPGKEQSFAGHGVDQFQAIYLSLQMIGTEIYCSDHHKSGRLYFDRPGNGYGFPVPNNIRDMLVGDDKKFEG